MDLGLQQAESKASVAPHAETNVLSQWTWLRLYPFNTESDNISAVSEMRLGLILSFFSSQ